MHADLDAFFASVAQRDDPALRGRPVIVGGGVVLAASYEARAFGIHSAMGGGQARRLCPHALVVSPDWDAYVEASKSVFEIFDDTSPVVEKISIDEAFIDVGGLERISGTPGEIARRLRAEVRRKVGLPITVGVATTRHLAKVASGVAKPDGLLVVEPERELEFLHPLPVERLWGVGPATAERLHSHGLDLVADVAAMERPALMALIGRHLGRHLHALAHNRDPRRVRSGRGRRSFGAQCALGRRSRSQESVDATLVALVERVTRRMRTAGRVGRTITLRLRFRDFSRATRSHTLAHATAASRTVLATARALLAAAEPTIHERGLTLVGVAVSNIDRGARQLDLEGDGPGTDALDAVLDELRDRYGPDAVRRAVLLDRNPQLATWLFPGEEPEV
jgi:DNA polymerase-4